MGNGYSETHYERNTMFETVFMITAILFMLMIIFFLLVSISAGAATVKQKREIREIERSLLLKGKELEAASAEYKKAKIFLDFMTKHVGEEFVNAVMTDLERHSQ